MPTEGRCRSRHGAQAARPLILVSVELYADKPRSKPLRTISMASSPSLVWGSTASRRSSVPSSVNVRPAPPVLTRRRVSCGAERPE